MGIVRNRQALFALFLMVLNAGYFAEALTLPRPFQLGEPGPAFLPIVLSIVLFVACARVLYMEMRGIGDPEDPEDAVGRFGPRPVLLILATAGFILAFEPIGYWIATLAYTFFVAALFEYERTSAAPLRVIAVAAAVAVGVTVSGWLFFVTLFDLFLPTGSF